MLEKAGTVNVQFFYFIDKGAEERMQFGFWGINYKNAPLAIRDKTSFTERKKEIFFQRAKEIGIEQGMVLSTCNRSEVYYIYEKEEQNKQVQKIYMEMFPEVDLTLYMTGLFGKEAIAYLFRVAAGLESLVLGEDQILGQVKDALDDARTMGYSGKELNKIVRDAVTCAKRIKTEWKISEKPLSVSSVGVRKLEESFGIAGKRVLVIGSGKTAVLALKYIYEYPVESVTVCSRTYGHARQLREEFPEIRIVSYEERYRVMAECEIVVSATRSPHLVVRREEFCPARKMGFLDLAAPRDVDMAFAEEEQVTLINLDTLQEIVEENWRERERLVEESMVLIEQGVEETEEWVFQSRMDDTIESLQQQCKVIVEDSFAYLNRRMELKPREQKMLRKVLNASLQRMLREPIQQIKRSGTKEEQEEVREAVRRLFQI